MRLQKEFPGCEYFNYSIIYSQYYQKYYVVSDIDCDSQRIFFPLIGEHEDTEEEVEEEKEKELEIEEEKIEERFEEEVKEEEFIIEE